MDRSSTSLFYLRAAVAATALLLHGASAQAQFDSAQVSGVVQDTTGAGVNIRVDVQLEVGQLSETVQVQAATTFTDTAVIGRTVSAERLVETPLSGRRAAQVAQLSAGLMGRNLGTFGWTDHNQLEREER